MWELDGWLQYVVSKTSQEQPCYVFQSFTLPTVFITGCQSRLINQKTSSPRLPCCVLFQAILSRSLTDSDTVMETIRQEPTPTGRFSKHRCLQYDNFVTVMWQISFFFNFEPCTLKSGVPYLWLKWVCVNFLWLVLILFSTWVSHKQIQCLTVGILISSINRANAGTDHMIARRRATAQMTYIWVQN